MIAENFVDRQRLEFIVVRRRCPMRVDVADLVRRDPSILDRPFHHADGAGPGFIRHCHVKRVAAHSITDDFREYVCPARLCKLQLFENEDSCSLAYYESVTFQIERPRSTLRIIVPSRKGTHRSKARHRHRRYRAFRTTADHRVGIAALDQTKTVADSVCSCRASGRRGRVRTLGTVANGNIAGGEIRDRGNYKEWRDT